MAWITEERRGHRPKAGAGKKMRISKKIISAVLALLFIFGSVIQVAAAGSDASEVPRVTFTNEYDPMPDLYISKTVVSADDRYPAPEDAEFLFTLKLDGKLAANRQYRVFDKNGNEVFHPQGEHVAFKTSRSGDFTLKADQTALFEAVGTGTSYEVTEQPLEDFIQIDPANGSAVAGTVTSEGAVASFTNMYVPKSEGKNTKLTVTKRISFPEGYQLPPDAKSFGYTLELGGKPYANEAYTVTDVSTGEIVGTGTTDEKGHFFIDGGQTATFDQVKVDVDYRVTEDDEKENWWVVGDRVAEGATQSPITTVNYTNATAAFVVTKTLSDKTEPDVNFTFFLTDAERRVWKDAKYYLYTVSGNRVDEKIYHTGEDGSFTLKPGQAAVFFGIEPGTVYNVKEQADPDYVQQIPNSADGYTDKVVQDTVELLPFVNKQSDEGRILKVTKLIKQSGEEAPLIQDSFQFKLSKREASGDFSAVKNAGYSVTVGSSQYTYETDEEGLFTIKANETAVFKGLSSGTYKVEEVGMNSEYQPENGIFSLEGELVSEPLSFTFTNVYTPKMLDMYLVKKNHSDDVLQGAEFMLYRDENLNNPVQAEPLVTDSEGKITIQNLKAGIYYLVETKSPQGYQLLANPVKLELSREGNHISVTIDGKKYTTTDPDEQIYIQQNDDSNDEVHITIYNSRSFGLPVTGGAGAAVVLVLAGMIGIIFIMWRMTKNRTN